MKALFFFILAMSSFSLVAHAADLKKYNITASDYCDFLNNTAASDPYYLYDEGGSTDYYGASIIRQGEPGSYRYFLIAGREKKSVSYVSPFHKIIYCDYNGITTEETLRDDDLLLLASNKKEFSLLLPTSHLLNLSSDGSDESSSWMADHKGVLTTAGIIATALVGAKIDSSSCCSAFRIKPEKNIPKNLSSASPSTIDKKKVPFAEKPRCVPDAPDDSAKEAETMKDFKEKAARWNCRTSFENSLPQKASSQKEND